MSQALRYLGKVETLAEGFNFLANTSGRTSEVIAGNLKEITGNAECILIPFYSKQNKLLSLKIVSFENWDNLDYVSVQRTKWINRNVRKKISELQLVQTLLKVSQTVTLSFCYSPYYLLLS